ncbi:MAG: SMI1/KNR4 family protein [Ruminococcus sp.]|nr:SMI1/KNR4 family protein [Ruminococcus sp.]
MYIPEIPNNSLTDEITQIVELSKKLEDEGYYFDYDPPATEEELSSWEKENNIKIPESLKDWLRFSRYSNICSELAIIKGVNAFKIDCELVPEDMVIIGEVIGDGEFIGFSKETGEIMWEDHGEVTKLESFDIFLKDTLIRMLKDS